jgi:hypothetical protein
MIGRLRLSNRIGWTLAIVGSFAASDLAFASGHGAPAHGEPAHGEEHASEAVDYSGLKTRGIDLGEYRIRTYYPVDAQKSTVRFVLHISVASEHYAEMKRLVENHVHKLRDQVITATRMTPLALFDESELKTFRRRLFARLSRALPELALEDVYISEFQLTVKSL